MNIKFDNIDTVGSLWENNIKQLQFSKNTLVYGENGMGKSTIVSLFNGLSHGEKVDVTMPKIHGGRTNLQYTVEIDGNICDQETSKGKLKNELLVFDKDFISRNIVNEDNMILFGNAAYNHKIKMSKIEEKQKDIDELELKCNSLGIEFEKTDDFYNSFKAYYQNVIAKIDNKNNITDSKEYIDKTGLNFQFDTIENIPEIIKFVRKKIKVPKIVLNHIISHTLKRNAIWQIDGLDIIHDEECPFCGQKFSKEAKKLVDGYSRFKNNFDSNIYNQLNEAVKRLNEFRSKVEDINSKMDYLFNQKVIKKTIYKHIKEKYTNSAVLDELITNLTNKINEPNLKQKIGKKARYLFLRLNNFNMEIDKINDIIDKFDGTKLKVDIYNAIINNPTDAEICFNYSKKIVEINKCIEQCDKAIKTESCKGNCRQMNKILKMLSAPFTINYEDGKYSISLKNIYKPFKLKQNLSEDKLSEGEKKLLAFSYFLTIAIAKDVKVIVYDDPMDCYDIPNRVHLINAINNYMLKNKNVISILLSHDKIFLNSIAYNLDFRVIDYDYYKMTDNGLIPYVKTDSPRLEPILHELVFNGAESTNFNDQISGLMALRIYAEICKQNGEITDSDYCALEECLTYCIHSKYAEPIDSSKPVIYQPADLENYHSVGNLSFDGNKYKNNMASFTGIDDVVAKQMLNDLNLNPNNKIKNALLLRVISEAFFMKKTGKNPKATQIEKTINNTLIEKIKNKSNIDDDILIIASINSTLASYMHPKKDSTYDLLDFSELEINKMVNDLKNISPRV